MDAVSNSIRRDHDLKIDGYERVRDMKVIDAIYESVRTGGPVACDGERMTRGRALRGECRSLRLNRL